MILGGGVAAGCLFTFVVASRGNFTIVQPYLRIQHKLGEIAPLNRYNTLKAWENKNAFKNVIKTFIESKGVETL